MLSFGDFIRILFNKIKSYNLYTQVTWCTLISVVLLLLTYYVTNLNSSKASENFIKSF